MTRSLGFHGDGIISWFALRNHSGSWSFLVVHTLFSQVGFWQGDSGRLVGHVVSSRWWWLLISCRKTTHVNGYYGPRAGWANSVTVLPLIWNMLIVAILMFIS